MNSFLLRSWCIYDGYGETGKLYILRISKSFIRIHCLHAHNNYLVTLSRHYIIHMFKSSKRAFSRERRLSKIGGVASLGSSPSMQESFELETIAQLPSVRLTPTGDFAYSDAPTASTIPIRATANARIRAASLLWPPEVFGSASTRTIPIDSRLQQNSKASSTSALSGSRREAQEVSPRVANSQSSLRAVSGPVFDLMTAAWYTVASHATLPQSVEKLSGKVLDTVSEGRKAIEEVIEENGLSTQSTVPLRKPRYKPGKLDPSKIQIPLRPAPCSLSLDTNAPDSDWISNSGSVRMAFAADHSDIC